MIKQTKNFGGLFDVRPGLIKTLLLLVADSIRIKLFVSTKFNYTTTPVGFRKTDYNATSYFAALAQLLFGFAHNARANIKSVRILK